MRLADDVQHTPRPGAIHAAEDHVAVECGPEPRLLTDAEFAAIKRERRAGRASCRCAGGDLDLRPGERCILRCRVQDAIEVVLLDPIEVEDYHALDSHPRETLDYDAADTTGANDADVQTCEVR